MKLPKISRPANFDLPQCKGFRSNLRSPADKSTDWKTFGNYAMFGIVFTFVGLFIYPILVDPILHTNKYKKRHEEIQTELYQSGLLPGQLRKWDDPYTRE